MSATGIAFTSYGTPTAIRIWSLRHRGQGKVPARVGACGIVEGMLRILLVFLLASAALPAQSARALIESGMERFVRGEIAASVKDFDSAAAADPSVEAHLWQRGIAHYYLGRFDDGRKQFEIHRTVNPDDVENATWWYLCMAKLGRRDEARKKLLPVGPDPRVPMREVYELYAGRGSEKQVLAAIERGNPTGEDRRLRLFYGHLYLALYADAAGDTAAARRQLQDAVDQKVGGYMWEVARIHLKQLR